MAVPFNLACGTCRNCNEGFTSACLRANPSGQPGAGYGYPAMGPYWGGQADLLRVPWADFDLLELPQGTEHELDYTMLLDIFPTGYHGTELAKVDVVKAIMDATEGFGVDSGVEAVGYQAHDHTGEEHPGMAMDNLISVVRATGAIGVVGVYEPEKKGASTDDAKEGRYDFDIGTTFTKDISIGAGQCPVKKYNRHLRDVIIHEKATPGAIVSHELSLDEAVTGHDQFDKRVDGWTKGALHPAA